MGMPELTPVRELELVIAAVKGFPLYVALPSVPSYSELSSCIYPIFGAMKLSLDSLILCIE